MKYLISLIILLSALQLKAQHEGHNMPTPKTQTKKPVAKKTTSKSSQKVIYTCPMHPEVQMTKPGSCPKCGMPLVKKTIKVATPKSSPQKPKANQTSLSKEAEMKQMDMPVKTEIKAAQHTIYTCPMHPEVHATKPGNCP
ncbi:MAG: heavy metal-binding domain-containing protein, partial [Ferruginibacter sp.]